MSLRPFLTRDEMAQAGLGVSFDAPGGPLLCLCGLAGGVGTTTLAYLIALCAANESAAPVLVCDGGGPTAALSDFTGASSRRSLPELAELADDGERVSRQVFAQGPHGVRVIATAPRFRLIPDVGEAIQAVLADACAAHGLTVVDCGTLQREPEHAALEMATHVAWVAPTTKPGLARARDTLELVHPGERRELVLAAAPRLRDRSHLATLKRLAASRRAPLVLLPPAATLAATAPGPAIEIAQAAFAAIGAELGR